MKITLIIYILTTISFISCEKINIDDNFKHETRTSSNIENGICLTLDDFPNGYSQEIVNYCIDNNIRLSVFVIGNQLELLSDTLLAKLKVNENIITLENHTWSHPNLYDADKFELRNEVLEWNYDLLKFCRENGLWNAGYFRPPYGKIRNWQVDFIKEFYGGNTLLWDIDPTNWDNENDLNYFKNKIYSYDNYDLPVIVLHGNKLTYDNMEIFKELKENKGVIFINLLEYNKNKIIFE